MKPRASHVLDRLCALHAVFGLLDAAAAPVRDGEMTPEERGRAAVICSRIAQTAERCKSMEPDASGEIRLINRIRRMNTVIVGSFGKEVDAREAVAAVMARVAIEEEALPRTPALLNKRIEWGQLHSLLNDLYTALDPDLVGVEQINKGALVGARMKAA